MGQSSSLASNQGAVKLRSGSSVAPNMDINKLFSGYSVEEDAQKLPEMNTARALTNRELWAQHEARNSRGVKYAFDTSRFNT